MRNNTENNRFEYSPHITILRVINSDIFEVHRGNIESIITKYLKKLQNQNVNTGEIYLYAVNSIFKPEKQVKIPL